MEFIKDSRCLKKDKNILVNCFDEKIVFIKKFVSTEMRIISPQLGISPLSNLGGEVVDRETLKGLARLGVEIKVLLPRGRPYPKVKNIKVSFAPIKHIFPPYVFNFFVFLHLWRNFKKQKFDLIRIHNPYFVGLGAWFFKKFFSPKTPLVPFYHHFEKSWLKDCFDKFLIKKWDLILTGSQASKKEIIDRFGVAPKKIKVVYHGVFKHFKPQKRDKRLMAEYGLKDRVTLLFIGVLTKRKNVSFLLDLLDKLKDKEIKLIICGAGPEFKGLKKRTKDLNLTSQIISLKPRFGKELVRLYNLADVFVFPTLKEGFGIVVAEAMACGLPVLVSQNSSLSEIVGDGKNGFLAKTNDLKEWEKKLRLLLEDEQLRKKIGKTGRKKVLNNFSWEKTARKTYEIYKAFLKERK